MRVSTADLIERFDDLSHHAEAEPVTITIDGRDKFVFVSIEIFERLSREDPAGPSASVSPPPTVPAAWGAMRGLLSWDRDDDVIAPTGEVWKADPRVSPRPLSCSTLAPASGWPKAPA